MDRERERLAEVRTQDITESKVNEDFVDWLKTAGPTWLLVIMVALCGYLGVVRFRQGKAERQSEAWSSLSQAELPGAFEDVANNERFAKVGQVQNMARLSAADDLLRQVQAGLTIGATVAPPAPGTFEPTAVNPADLLTEADRTDYLARAERLFRAVLESTQDEPNALLFTINAHNGLAAIAECRGDMAAAQAGYEAAAAAAEGTYPGLAVQARARAASVSTVEARVLPSKDEVAVLNTQAATIDRAPLDAALRDLILPAPDDGP